MRKCRNCLAVFWQISCLQVFCAFSQLVLARLMEVCRKNLIRHPESVRGQDPGQAGGEEAMAEQAGLFREEPPARVDVRLS